MMMMMMNLRCGQLPGGQRWLYIVGG